MGLRARIDNGPPTDQRQADVTPIVERRGGEERRLPRWIERKNEQGLPAKDLTGRVAA